MPDAPTSTPSAATDPAPFPLPPLTDQAERLIALGVPALTGIDAGELRAFAEKAAPGAPAGSLLAVHPDAAPASALAPLLSLAGKPGFVVVDMEDVDAFAPQGVELPEGPFYLLHAPDRGDHLGNWSPEEALPALTAAGRTPLLLTEGIHWLLQRPEVLERNKCFMTIASRLPKPGGTFDARTPAIWISNGTGRDGKERKGAPKVGWCWWNNRHTWLGFGSTTGRSS
ncbi:DUF5701 family protein [Streptomyces filamentosus]|uniref:Uncharacterized protein n=1 Tax=Streptomyces filamentosus TaxID=67294 RepID=A0A919BXT7_STRFL|nr:DUF5701 family protein [Streptomyces filamentosus]GHG27648.1 hypothetical protein GCM10017667_75680 [Streptomyces filamentosus]